MNISSKNMQKIKSKIKYADLYGLRKEKYKFLESHNVKNTKWQTLELKEPHYFLVPKDFGLYKKYETFFSLSDIFIFNNVGGKPGDDAVLVGDSVNDVRVKLNQFISLLKLDGSKARTEADKNLIKILNDFEIKEENIIRYNYRPFDLKYSYYDKQIYTRPVLKLKEHFNIENICLLTTKIVTTHPFQHAFVSEIFPDVIFLSNRGSTNTYVFPLYLYNQNDYATPKKEKKNLSYGTMMMFDAPQRPAKQSNIKKEVLELLKIKYEKAISPEEIFYYIYAVLYSNKYREKYQEFLKIDFPRAPFTKDYKLFKDLGKLGKELAELHLLKSKKLNKTLAKFKGAGLNEVKKRDYQLKQKRLYINDSQYFEGIEPEVWNYYIGGYQVLDKWIKDRLGKNLKREEVEHYLKIATSLKYTIELQKEIDKLYPETEKLLIKI